MYSALARLAHEYDFSLEKKCPEASGGWRRVIALVYKARREPLARPRSLWEIACLLANAAGPVDPTRAGLLLPQEVKPGLHTLIDSVYSYYKNPTSGSLRRAIWSVAKESTRPCSPDPLLAEEIARRERRMKTIGIVMGLLLPALFIASFIASVTVGVIIVVLGALLWYMIRVEGSVYHRLVLEDAWTRCTLTDGDLENILHGRPNLPSLFEILGISEPRLD